MHLQRTVLYVEKKNYTNDKIWHFIQLYFNKTKRGKRQSFKVILVQHSDDN